jgi:hypothetical protein
MRRSSSYVRLPELRTTVRWMRRSALRAASLLAIASAVVFWPLAGFFAIYDGYVEDVGQTPSDFTGELIACIAIALGATLLAVNMWRATRRDEATELP